MSMLEGLKGPSLARTASAMQLQVTWQAACQPQQRRSSAEQLCRFPTIREETSSDPYLDLSSGPCKPQAVLQFEAGRTLM